MKNTPVLIIGAGPAGLSLALALARQNVCSLVLERRSGINNHPRARGVKVRTMELFRQWGCATELLKYEQPKESRRIIWAQSLQGEEIARVAMDDSTTCAFSPEQASQVSQDHVEAALLHALASYHQAQVRFSKEFIAFEEDEAGIVARILDKNNNQEELIRAQYLIAADGAHSRVRQQLGVAMVGPDNLGQACNIYCDIDISAWTRNRPAALFFFTDLKLLGRYLMSVDGARRWIIGSRFSEQNSKEDFTDDYCINLVREVVGLPNLAVNIISKSFWTMAAQTASQYRKGRVFLMGDAAHRLPPTGAFGMNVAVQDAHNLAWKLAMVINYHCCDQLLNTYDDERAPVVAQDMKWSLENGKCFQDIFAAIYAGDTETLKLKLQEQQNNVNFAGLDLGFIYHSKIVNSENDLTLSMSPSEYVPTSLPGSRAPHVKLIQNDKIISTLDLFEKDFVLLIGEAGESWREAVRELSQTLMIPIIVYKIAAEGELIDADHVWYDTYEITKSGAVLVRPDGHVAWRSKLAVANPKAVLETYFANFC